MTPLVDGLLQSATDPTWIVGRDALLVGFNPGFARLFAGVKGESARVGGSAVLFDPVWGDLFERTMQGRSVSMNAPLLVDGALRTFALGGTPVTDERAVTHAIFTARELPDARPGSREDLFELSLTRLFLTDDHPLHDTLGSAVEYLCESDEWDCGVIWLLGDDTSALDPVAIYAASGLPHGDELHTQIRAVRFPRGRGLPGRAWAADDIVWVADIADESNVARAHLARRLELHGAVAVPLRDAARIVGVLELFTRDVRPVDELRARALLRTGAGMGRLISRRRAEDERRRLLGVIERKGFEWSLTFDSIELPIFITSFDGVVRRMNRAARDLAGEDYSEVIGRRLRELGHGEPWTTLAASIDAVRDSGETCTAQSFDGESDRTWDIAANAYQPGSAKEGEPARAIVVARETTNIVRLQSAVRRGEQLSALGELVAGVAHEVRNPIFGMQITLEALEASLPKDADVGDLLQVLRRWLERLTRLMENLLAYGRTWTINLEQGLVGDVVKQALEGTQPVADAAHVKVRTTIDVSRPVLMDASRLVHAFENLITNAVQHSAEESEVVVHAREVDGFVELSVRDHGPGFAATDLPRIFEPFFTRRRGGTGLGLAIVQRIVDEHGGTVHAGNAETGGATVTIRFPVYQASPT